MAILAVIILIGTFAGAIIGGGGMEMIPFLTSMVNVSQISDWSVDNDKWMKYHNVLFIVAYLFIIIAYTVGRPESIVLALITLAVALAMTGLLELIERKYAK